VAEYNYYERLKESLEQVVAYTKGDSSKVHVSVRKIPVPEYKAKDVSRVRTELRLSQRALASVLGVSHRTVEAWEAGRNVPNGPATRVLYLIEKDHSLVDKLVIR
jgi:putative transcriptional regulator